MFLNSPHTAFQVSNRGGGGGAVNAQLKTWLSIVIRKTVRLDAMTEI